jgi:hypothetical protein
MRASIILGAGILLSVTLTAEAQSSRRQARPPPQSPPVVIIERDRLQPPPAPERRVTPPRSFQEISPPMQGPTPLSPMAPRIGN